VSDTIQKKMKSRNGLQVDSANARSWQLVSALSIENFDVSYLGRSDQIILDMEDAVDESLKDLARKNVRDWLTEGGSAWVRVNDVTTSAWEADLLVLNSVENLAGVVLAKTESADQVTDTFQRLGGHVPVIPLLESALGIEDAVEIARARGTFRLAFGSGDYRKDTGAENTSLAMAYPRTRMVLASRISSIPAPIDGPTVGSSHALLREQTAEAVSLGMTGKLCLDHEQPVVINESMSPTPADVAWATDFINEFHAGGGVVRDGSDKPRLARATKVLERAKLFRVGVPLT
jgi:citrate lyase subunit beta/citryl-CoA lyase